MEKIKVVIIDSGVDREHPALRGRAVEGFSWIEGAPCDGFADTYGHGTAVYGIISREPEAHILNIKLIPDENGAEESALISLLQYIDAHLSADILHMSIGLTICEHYDALYDVCQRLTDKGVLLVSAFDNTGSISYPAAFPNVLGVISGSRCNGIDSFEWIEDPVLNLAAKGSKQRVLWTNGQYIMMGGNSFACAHVTRQAVRFMAQGIRSREAVCKAFQSIALHCCKLTEAPRKASGIFPMQKAALFPFNKEMHSLLRFQHLLDFEIADVYDTKYSLAVGNTTDVLLKDQTVAKRRVRNVADIQWDSFDTLILGHVDELSGLLNTDKLVKYLVKNAVARQKKIYSFEPLDLSMGENLYYPRVSAEDLPPDRFGMLYRISKPVVGVFGTSSAQGKFTLQLKLRELFQQRGYRVGQIGTEPSALLFGMDYVFPMGYHSTVEIQAYDTVRYLNALLNDLCRRDTDILLVGSQSGTIPYDTGNLAQFTLPQYHFLMGTQPDAVVLCVNPFDELEYIERTVRFIEASADCKVLAIVVFPMGLQNDWYGIWGTKTKIADQAFEQLKARIQQACHVAVWNLDRESELQKLADGIVDFFSEESEQQ